MENAFFFFFLFLLSLAMHCWW